MDAKITQIEVLLDKLNLLFDQAKEDGKLDKLEQELMLKYTRQLSELLHSDIPVSVPTVHREEPPKEINTPPVMDVLREEVIEEIAEIKVPEDILVPEELNPVPPAEVEVPKVEEIKKVEPPVSVQPEKMQEIIREAEPEKKSPPVKKPLVSHEEESDEAEFNTGLNKKLTGQSTRTTLADKIIAGKSKDLKSVIDLNVRISLTRQLFADNKEAYDITIKTLNNTSSYAEAEQYILDVLRPQMGWKNLAAVNQLLDLVKMKFS